MAHIITTSHSIPAWIEQALAKAAQQDLWDNVDSFDAPSIGNIDGELDEFRRSEKERIIQEQKAADKRARDQELQGQLINPSDFNSRGRRRLTVPASIKNKAQKAVQSISNGWHREIPLTELFDALINLGLVPIQEDGERWSGMLVGGHECGSEGSRKQVATFEFVFKNPENKWALTNTYMHLSWCKMPSGKYEVVCYMS